MRILGFVGLLVLLTAQNPPQSDLGVVQGVVMRIDSNEPMPGVQVALEGGPADPKAMQSLLSLAAGAGLVITPPPGASLSEATQLLTATAAARGLPIQPQGIQNLVNRAVGDQAWPTVTTDLSGKFTFRRRWSRGCQLG